LGHIKVHSFGKDNGLAIYNRMKACGELWKPKAGAVLCNV